MKNTLLKVWGIVLTLAILSGLLVASVPVAAADNQWTSYPVPTFYPGSSANVYAFTGDGSAIYVFNNGDNKLYKSTNDGATFSNLNMDTNGNLAGIAGVANDIIDLKIDPADPNIMIATNGISLYRSTNGGKLWNDFTPSVPAGFGNALFIDIADASGAVYLACDGANISIYDSNNGVWKALNALTGIIAARFAPNYAESSIVVALTGAGTTYTLNTCLNDGLSGWNADLTSPATFTDGNGATQGYIALPSNFDILNYKSFKAFIALNNSHKIWRATASSSSITKTDDIATSSANVIPAFTTDPNNAADLGGVSSLALNGTTSSATLVAGDRYASNLFFTANPYVAATTVSWSGLAGDLVSIYGAAGNTKAQFKPGTSNLYVGTSGDNSALFVNNGTTYDSYYGVGFFNAKTLGAGDVSISSLTGAGTANETAIMKVNGKYLLMVSSDTGATWKSILLNDFVDTTAVKKYDTTWIFGQGAMPNVIDNNTPNGTNPNGYLWKQYLKSTDNGATWYRYSIASGAAGNTLKVFVPIDADNYWLGNTSGLRKSSTATYTTIGLTGETPNLLIDYGAFMFLRTTNQNAYTSDDKGVTWKTVGIYDKQDFPAGPPPTFDVGKKTIYQQTATTIRSWEIGTSTAWKTELTLTDLPAALTGASLKGLGKDGFWYFSSTDASGTEYGQLWRSEKLTVGSSFNPVKYTTKADMGGTLGGGPATGASDDKGNSVFDVNVTLANAPTNGYTSAKRNMVFTYNVPPTMISPVADAELASPLDIRCNAVGYAGPVQYQFQVAYDAAMTTAVTGFNPNSGTATLLPNQAFIPGTYYLKVRAGIPVGDKYSYSKWSTPFKFIVKLQGVGTDNVPALTNRIFPDNGASGVAVNTPFTWGTVANATSYNIDISTDSAFTTNIATATGLTGTSYTTKDALKAGTIYYWRVQAVNANGKSDWVTSAFTTALASQPGGTTGPTTTAAPATPIVTVNVPTITVPQPSVIVTVPVQPNEPTGTPAWAWIVIAIGAVLVIAVIVLIVRTRRV